MRWSTCVDLSVWGWGVIFHNHLKFLIREFNLEVQRVAWHRCGIKESFPLPLGGERGGLATTKAFVL